MSDERPLFIPLRREWFDAFASGAKAEEWRRHGPRWNAGTCRVGRQVILCMGYSGARLTGVLTAFQVRLASGPVADLYGEGTECAVLTIALNRPIRASA